jgi:putative addiction module CopG family antidote
MAYPVGKERMEPMEATRRMEIELPEELAESVSAQVASGRFANESEAVASALMLLRDRDAEEDDPELDAWLRGEVVPRYEEWKAGGGKGLTVDEVRASLARRRAARRDHDAAE